MYVEEKNYLLALNGLKKFVTLSKEKKRFSMIDLKNFMEPIFWEAGYRGGGKTDTQTAVLIVVTGGAGDLINSSAVIRETRRLYPDAYITLCVPQFCSMVVENCPYVNEIVGISEIAWFNHDVSRLISQVKVAITLLRRRYHIAFAICNGTASVAELTCYVSGARTIKSNLHVERGRMHQVDVDLSVLDSITGHPISNRKMEVWISSKSMAYARNLIRNINGYKYCAVCVGGSGKRKQYPPQHYVKLLRLILTEERMIFLILGGKEEKRQGNIIKEDLKEHAVDLTGTTLDEAAAILKYCDYCITNDTVTLHIASALGVPVLQIHCFPVDLNPYAYNMISGS
ncbi:MAG: glycosyltransferase family 9 protein [Selenomonadaceae bacterium]|nr:glycosyltransferase family 9 protein [Selenomonadaceae bacterium]